MPQFDIAGTIVLYAGLAVQFSDTGTAHRSIAVTLLPAFKSLSVQSVKVGNQVDATAAAGLIASILGKYADNVTGLLVRQPILEAKVADTYLEPYDPSTTIRLGDSVQGEVVIKSNPVTVPIRIDRVAWSIYPERIVALATLVPVGMIPSKPEGSVFEPTADAIAATVRQIFASNFGRDTWPSSSWVSVRNDLVALAVNDVFHQASLCAKADASVGGQKFSQTISFPDETSVDCTPTRDCTPTGDCSVSANHDDRNCSACLLYSPRISVFGRVVSGGHCVQSGNDPFCEAAKKTQNKIYDADAALRKFDCERVKSQKKLSCEAEKSGQKALCETGKELLKRLARTGKFANLSGDYTGSGKLQVCLRNFALAGSLRQLQMSVDTSGTGELNVGLRFVPLDIVGHLTCQAPWTEQQRVAVQVPDKTVTLNAKAQIVVVDGATRLKVNVDPLEIPLRTSPTPTEIMLKSVNATIACQGLNLVKPLILAATPFVPELKGELTVGRKAMEFTLPLVIPTHTVRGHKVDGKVELGNDAVFLSGIPQ